MLFDFYKYFCLVPDMKIVKVACNESDIEVSSFNANNVVIPQYILYDTITQSELDEFIDKVHTIVCGKFCDEETPNYDIIKSFIELSQMFDRMIMLK